MTAQKVRILSYAYASPRKPRFPQRFRGLFAFGTAQWIEKRHKSKAGAVSGSTTAFSPSPLNNYRPRPDDPAREAHRGGLAYGGWADRETQLRRTRGELSRNQWSESENDGSRNDKALTGKENSQSYAQRRRAEKKEALRDFLRSEIHRSNQQRPVPR